ncbi:monovalent cation/H(+) antiporter subunit G [Raineyella fluvialis]|nr:monovalent cation/H(+) antiporter subunit G [Raineyella fluvialis]
MIGAVLDLLAALLCLVGALLCLTAAVGLVRFPDLVSRMHPAAKPQSLGIVVLLLGVVLHVRTWSAFFLLLLVTVLQMMTVTLASHVVARTGYRARLIDPRSLVADELALAVAERARTDRTAGAAGTDRKA